MLFMQKLVTVIVPCYRHEEYVRDCLDSIINQTYQNIELIVCDDCSPDHSYDIICSMKKQLEDRFTSVILIRNDVNQGVTKNLNRMIRLAKGEYIKDIASDDMLMPDCIENLVDYMENHPCDLAYSNGWEIGEDTKYVPKDSDCKKRIYEEKPKSGKNLTGDICAYNFISSPSAIYPKETFEKYGLYDESLMIEDFEYMLRVSVDGNIGYLDKETIWYRVSDNSMSHYDGSDESLARMRKINQCRDYIFAMYEKYCDDAQVARYYNDNVALVISVNDKKSLCRYTDEIKKRHISLSRTNKIKLILYKTGLYSLVRRCLK